jgi:hypothetical protein
MKSSVRQFIVGLCGSLSIAALVLGVIYTYSARTFFNSSVFASRVADGLQDPAMARLVATELSDQIIAFRQDLIAYRPVIVGAMERVVVSSPFRAVVRRAVKQAHETVFSKTGENIALTVGDLSMVVEEALSVNPELAAKLPPEVLQVLGSTREWTPGKNLARAMYIGERMRRRALFLLGLGVGLAVLGFVAAERKDRYLLRCGIGLTGTALVLGVAAQFGAPGVASVVKPRFASDLTRALWPAFVTPLALRMWIMAGMGITVIAGVTSTFRRVNIAGVGAELWRIVAGRPQHTFLGLLRGTLLVLAGSLALFHPTVVLQIAVIIAAVVLFFFGLQEIFSITLDWLPRVEAAVGRKGRGSLVPRVVFVSMIGAVVIGAGAFWLNHEDARAPVVAMSGPMVCNGHPELCARRLNQVAFATSHNSMSGGDIADWMFPNQDRGIPAQLKDGVRGFLVDIHYGIPVGDRIKTLLDDEVNARAKYEAAMGKEAVEAAMRMRDRMVGEPTGERDVYLAHGFCELGATRFVDVLKEMNEFLVANPGEVVILVIQDEGVAPADVAACFEASGLIDLVYTGPAVKPWPTLGEMVHNDERVVVFAENQWEGVPWYHGAFEVFQETPYQFKTPEAFSNKAGRGGKNGSLLLMNHWIETTPTPLPSNAEIVNSYDVLLKRAQACKKQRRMMPNLVAVDFYRTGDLLRVVDALNGVEAPVASLK